jgi:hypothetical protein
MGVHKHHMQRYRMPSHMQRFSGQDCLLLLRVNGVQGRETSQGKVRTHSAAKRMKRPSKNNSFVGTFNEDANMAVLTYQGGPGPAMNLVRGASEAPGSTRLVYQWNQKRPSEHRWPTLPHCRPATKGPGTIKTRM